MQSGPVSKLKQQLGFVKSIDQKLEGLRRENERLRRLVSNPRVRFSRSSLGGLHRIVTSLQKSGHKHEIDAVEVWADKTKTWLAALGKRGEGPSNDELDWLAETISELSELRESAASEIKKQIEEKGNEPPDEADEANEATGDDFDPKTLPPDAYVALEEMQDTPADKKNGVDEESKTEELPEPFPFKDEPKERSIAEAKFWKDGEKKPKESGFRDRTSTIPLAIGDLTSVPPLSKNHTPPPVPVRAPGFWRPLAILSLACAVVLSGLLYKSKQETRAAVSQAMQQVKEANTACAASKVAVVTPKPDAGTSPSTDTATEGTASADKDSKAPIEGDADAKDEKKQVATAVPEKKAPQKTPQKTGAKKPKHKKKAPPAKVEKTPAKGQGTLVVKSPADGAVLVLVDGISRGRTPARIYLSPGLHEITFMKDGKKKIRMVPIRPDATKTITAVIPE